MKAQEKVQAMYSAWQHALLFFPLFVVLLFSASGCVTMRDMLKEEEQVPIQEIAIQNPPAYGMVSQVTAATMKDKEIRLGDIAITVDADDGSVVVIIQPEDDIYKVGDRVRVIRDGRGLVRAQIL